MSESNTLIQQQVPTVSVIQRFIVPRTAFLRNRITRCPSQITSFPDNFLTRHCSDICFTWHIATQLNLLTELHI